MQRSRLLRAALGQLRCSMALLEGSAAASTALTAEAARMHLPSAAEPLLASFAACRQQRRGISAASMLMSQSKSDEQAKGGNGGGSGARPPPTAASAAGVPGPDEEGETASEEEEGEEAMAEAFDRLMQAAFEMVQQGKPMEAEYVLSEGAKQAAEILGENAVELAALYDQLCVICFLHDRMEQAQDAAKRALDIVKSHDSQGSFFGPATAIAATRYASTLLAGGNPQEAQLYAGQSIISLEKALPLLAEMEAEAEDEEEEADAAEARAKFEVGLGESKFYHALARQAQEMTVASVGEHLPEMQAGLEAMQQHLGTESPLVAAALREHSRLIMSALEEDQKELAEALYVQDARLHMAAGGNSEQVALTFYQCGTLQYVMGKYSDAAESLCMSLETVRQHFPEAEEHMLTVQQRLGMVKALLGEYEEARKLLQEVAPALVANLGEDNPATEELEFMLALVGLREMEADGIKDPVRRLEYLAAMERHLKALAEYGEDHMLVKKARSIYEEASGKAAAAAGGVEGSS